MPSLRAPVENEVTVSAWPWVQWFNNIVAAVTALQSGPSATVPLAKLTTGGSNGSLTITNGKITAISNPT